MKFKEVWEVNGARFWVSYKGKKNRIKFEIVDTKKLDDDRFYILMEDTVSNSSWNSCWRSLRYGTNDLDKVKKLCEQLATFYKDKRIPCDGVGNDSYERSCSKCDEFLKQYKEV